MSATVKAHGMDGTLVEPDWPPLTLAEVRALLASSSRTAASPIEILSVSPRPFSAASVVATTSGRVFVKRHHRTRARSRGIARRASLPDASARAWSARCRGCLPHAPAKRQSRCGEWTYEVHEAPEGVDLYGDALSWTPFRSAAHAHSAGQALARLHLASEGFDAPRRKPRPLVAGFTIFAARDPGAEMERYLAARPALACDVAVRAHCATRRWNCLRRFMRSLLPLLPALAPLWTHNDLHASNLSVER